MQDSSLAAYKIFQACDSIAISESGEPYRISAHEQFQEIDSLLSQYDSAVSMHETDEFGNTFLIRAVISGASFDVVYRIIAAGCPVAHKNRLGISALDVANDADDVAVAALLQNPIPSVRTVIRPNYSM